MSKEVSNLRHLLIMVALTAIAIIVVAVTLWALYALDEARNESRRLHCLTVVNLPCVVALWQVNQKSR